eukprot:7284491-Prymnesium_polylepis.1
MPAIPVPTHSAVPRPKARTAYFIACAAVRGSSARHREVCLLRGEELRGLRALHASLLRVG